MIVAYNPYLVFLSVVIAVQASYVGLRLATQLNMSDGTFRRGVLVGAALSLATGIWGMHFVGMLAIKLPFVVDYAVLPTLFSFLACVLVVGLALLAASLWLLNWWTLAGASLVMGLGIVTMHYIGMSALHAAAHLEHSILSIVLSILVSVLASGLALWLAFGQSSRRPPLIVSALTLGIAISGMHYLAMDGLVIHPMAMAEMAPESFVSPDMLAAIVAVVAFLVSGLFILMLIPDRRQSKRDISLAEASFAALVLPEQDVVLSPNAAASGRGTLPVHRDGILQVIDLDDVVSVQANAHYTHVSNGTNKLFCPLSITEAEERLKDRRFMRVHRSHIVNLDKVGALRKTVDSVMIEMDSQGRVSVPVSRSKVSELKNRLASPNWK